METRREELPVELRAYWDELLMPVDTDIKIDSVILSEENKGKIKTFIAENTHRKEITEYGLHPMSRILMYGASGTGKTYLSKALCNYLGYTMMYIDIADSLARGNVAENISHIFEIANTLGRCMIFLDECDSVAWSRDAKNSDGGGIRRVTNSIFQQLDQMKEGNIFISATNMLYRIDPAFERRFDMKMEFMRPDGNLKDTIRHFMLPKFKLDENDDKTEYEILQRRVKQNTKLSYYEIQCIVERAMKRSIINGTNIVKITDIYKDFENAMNIKIEIGR
jgi:cell division cycle protein 48